MAKTGRNDPCPCGSGKKYKKCCLPHPEEPTGLESLVRMRLAERLSDFLAKNLGDKLDRAAFEFWGVFDLEEQLPKEYSSIAGINFVEWLIFDRRQSVDEPAVIERFIESAKGLSHLDRKILKIMKDAVMSLYEIQDVRTGEGMTLKDLITGGVYEVKEKSATESLSKWDIIAVRLLSLDGANIINGSVYPYPPHYKNKILKALKEERKIYKRTHPKASTRDFLKNNSVIFNRLWINMFKAPLIPKVMTTSGEEFIFCKAVYEISDRPAVIKALESHPDIDSADHGSFVWLECGSKVSTIILGSIDVKQNRLTLECKSRERLEKGKALIAELAPGNARHRADSFEDVHQMLGSAKSKPTPMRDPSEEIPMEIRQELYENFTKELYAKTLTEKIPMLGNKAPVDLVKTKPGRKKVVEWLKLLENGEERKKHDNRPYIDMAWMWDRLGIDRDEVGAG